MADGEARTVETFVDTATEGFWGRVKNYRQTPFITWAIIAFLGLTSVVFWHTFVDETLLASVSAKLIFLIASSLLWLPLILLTRDSSDNFARGPSLLLPSVSITILLILATLAVANAYFHWNLFELSSQTGRLRLSALFTALGLVFFPQLFNAANLSHYQAKERSAAADRNESKHKEDDSKGDIEKRDTEAMGALVATILVILIGLLAFFAGDKGKELHLPSSIGVGLSILVVGIFAIVVFIEPLSNSRLMRFLSRSSGRVAILGRPMASLYNGLDRLLVRVCAVVAGMEHRTIWSRYIILGSQLVLLCVLGWYLPSPFGFVPIAIGLVLAISVSRLWAWVEDDRALAALTNFKTTAPYRTAMREDYRDETLLGFIFVFALMPIMMYQAHESGIFGVEMFDVPDGKNGFIDWVGFFGIELAKAIPIVDWAEIYQIDSAGQEFLWPN